MQIAPSLTLQVTLAGSEFIFATKTEAEMIKWMQAICEAATVQVSAWEYEGRMCAFWQCGPTKNNDARIAKKKNSACILMLL